MAQTVLSVENLCKTYRLGQYDGESFRHEAAQRIGSWFGGAAKQPEPFYALRDVNLTARQGEALGIIGSNGAGKSTLLKIISRITAPTSGTVKIKGRAASLLEIGTGFHRELTGRENIYLNGAIMGMSRAETAAHMRDILDFSEIEQFIDTPVKRYSSGMSVKLGFAVAAHLNPDLLICDEVLAVGDAAFQQKCLDKMQETAREGGTVLYVSHNMYTVERLCSRVICLERGQVTFDGAPDAGIALYAGRRGENADRQTLSDIVREAGLGEHVRLEWIRVQPPQGEGFRMDSDAEAEIGLWTDGEYADIRLRGSWLSGDFPAGVSDSGSISLQGGSHRLRLTLPLAALSSGEYTLRLQVTGRKNGGTVLLDSAEQACRIQIAEDRAKNLGVYWTQRYWGNVRLEGAHVSRAAEAVPDEKT